MPAFGPIKRADLIRTLHAVGFSGPYSGRQAGISREQWEAI
jgi:hypothetical protein